MSDGLRVPPKRVERQSWVKVEMALALDGSSEGKLSSYEAGLLVFAARVRAKIMNRY